MIALLLFCLKGTPFTQGFLPGSLWLKLGRDLGIYVSLNILKYQSQLLISEWSPPSGMSALFLASPQICGHSP